MTKAMDTQERVETYESTPSFAKPLFLGQIHDEMVYPYPSLSDEEQTKVDGLVSAGREFLDAEYDPYEAEKNGWVGDDIIAGLGERGLLGLYVPEEYGGQGLSQTAYCKVFEGISEPDPTLGVVLGVHQSIGMKPIVMFGTDKQKERFLPDLTSGRKLAAFALTEPNAGSDAYHLETRAVKQADGSYLLNGEKRYIGNGSKDVLVTFARDDNGKHIALIVQKGMAGFEVGEAYQTLGLQANDLRHLYFNNVRIPPENILGEVGDGFKIAMETLNNGRLSLGSGSIAAVNMLRELAVNHVQSREQFGQPLAEFELVETKIAWLEMMLYGMNAMAYLTTGLVDAGVPDYSLESAMVKVSGTEFLWYAANRVFQLGGGSAYMTDQPYEKILRDIRIFPIFEGANDVMRAFIALTGIKPLTEELSDLQDLNLRDPVRSLGLLVDYVGGRLQREIIPDGISWMNDDFSKQADSVVDQTKQLRHLSEKLLFEHGDKIQEKQRHQKRLADAIMDIYAQIATLSRISTELNSDTQPDDMEVRIAETFCRRAASRVKQNFELIEHNDDDEIHAIAQHVYHRYGGKTS